MSLIYGLFGINLHRTDGTVLADAYRLTCSSHAFTACHRRGHASALSVSFACSRSQPWSRICSGWLTSFMILIMVGMTSVHMKQRGPQHYI